MKPSTAIAAILALSLSGWAEARHGRQTSLDEAVSEARERYDGRVISAEILRDEEGHETYNVRILTPQGRVKRYRVSPERERRGYVSPPRRERRR
ncbi:MAG: hypothetical protein D6720_02240 [Gammaproteobacteria bacterium]|nr:MAG: hypothetical protein D6720_02240 [Gammaproteobacteria bacterium]